MPWKFSAEAAFPSLLPWLVAPTPLRPRGMLCGSLTASQVPVQPACTHVPSSSHPPTRSSGPQRLSQWTAAASFVDPIHPAAKSDLASPLSAALRFSALSPPSFGLERDLSVLWVGLTNPCTLAAEMLFEMGKLLANCSISRSSNKYSVPPMRMRSQRHELI